MLDLVIKNSKLIGKDGEYSIGVDEGKITEISRGNLTGDKVIDIKSNYLLPGFIDPHVHFRDPGLVQQLSICPIHFQKQTHIRRLKIRSILQNPNPPLIFIFRRDITA